MKLYTSIIDFNGGTYIRQSEANSPKDAVVSSLLKIQVPDLDGMTDKLLKAFIEGIKDPEQISTPVGGCENVWSLHALSDDESILIHVVQTEKA